MIERLKETMGVAFGFKVVGKLSQEDLNALETMLVEACAGTREDLAKVRDGSGLGLFVRSLVGLDREAARRAFEGFLYGKTLGENQIQFVNLIIEDLTQSGWMSPARLYETPFIDFSPRGVDGVFSPDHVSQLLGILDQIRQRADVN